MPAMQVNITIQYVGNPDPTSYNGTDISDAQAFMAGLSGDFQSVQASMSCTTVGGEGRSMTRGAVDDGCEGLLADIDAWLDENAANE